MACKLTRQDDGTFKGNAGARVRVDVRSTDGAATVVRIAYAGVQDGEAPFEFTIKPGKQRLLVAALGVKNNQLMRIVEVGPPDCHLRNFFWTSTHFFTALDIVGA